MKKRLLIGFGLVFAMTGCHNEQAPPKPLTMEQIPVAVEQAFSQADGVSKAAATDAADAVKNNDPDRALTALMGLSEQPGLTPAQRAAAAEATASLNRQLQDAAEKGDAKAAAALARYRASK